VYRNCSRQPGARRPPPGRRHEQGTPTGAGPPWIPPGRGPQRDDRRGRRAGGRPATIGNRELARARIRYRLADGATPPADLTAPPGPDGLIELAPDDLAATLHRLTGWALEQHVELIGLEVTRPTLEDVYLQLTDSPAAQAGAAGKPAAAAPGGRRGWHRS
jgi:hypothetical protein